MWACFLKNTVFVMKTQLLGCQNSFGNPKGWQVCQYYSGLLVLFGHGTTVTVPSLLVGKCKQIIINGRLSAGLFWGK